MLRFPKRSLMTLFAGKPLLFISELAYFFGFVQEWLLPKKTI
jgi:hypothetical protein